ncbi:MAG: shikimate dehydrogenase, partial [Lachnospiraceae bacterium]|nr:shikimate dehydrogenase [Lachnospiraceae bacterium]
SDVYKSIVMDYVLDEYKDVEAEKYIGIFGNPIKHTLSPVIHDTISGALNLNERYIPFHIENNLNLAIKDAFDRGILGLNITVPYKQSVMECLVGVDEAAKAIGAVNTLVRTENGYVGYNTDMPGLAKAIESEGVSLENINIIILGAGAAARAAVYMCIKYNAKKVYIINRTVENARRIADDMEAAFCVHDSCGKKSKCPEIYAVAAGKYKEIPNDKYIFIQCTSVGLHEGDGLPVVDDAEFYKMALFGVDLIYNPAKTPFIKLLEALGIKTMNGLKMLLYQGIMSNELWNKQTVDKDTTDKVYRALCAAVYGTGNNIVLVGYMGSGKTTIGKCISCELGYEFIDTDEYIVKKEGMSINDIFSKKGEEYFRRLETDTVREFGTVLHNAVIATGGGLPMRDENRKLLKDLGTVYYLKTEADTIFKRISGNEDRPLLLCENPYERICSMLNEREPNYLLSADVLIYTDNKSVEDVAREIYNCLL